MPTYKVIAPGFHAKKHYSPTGKRKTLTTDKPFTKKTMPSWLAEMPKESAAVAKKRKQREDTSAKKNADEVADGKKEVENTSFMSKTGGDSTVETL